MKSCVTCKWFKPADELYDRALCLYESMRPMPFWAYKNIDGNDHVRPDDGKDCDTWELDRVVHVAASILEDTYAAKASEALSLIEQLREKVQDLPAPDSSGLDWGHVGDLFRMVEVLHEALGEE